MPDRKTIVQRGEKALRELELSVTTREDKLRVSRIWLALRALDEHQAAQAETIRRLRMSAFDPQYEDDFDDTHDTEPDYETFERDQLARDDADWNADLDPEPDDDDTDADEETDE